MKPGLCPMRFGWRTNMRHEPALAMAEGRFALDPFGAVPNEASRVAGLGGAAPATEAGYVFRTVPVASQVGRAVFRVVLHDLTTLESTLSVELSVISDQPGAVPMRIVTVVRSLRELVAQGGALFVAFEAHRAHRYAVAGYSHGAGTIAATAITVELLNFAEAAAIITGEADSGMGDLSIEPVPIPRLRALEPPEFRDPLSQPMTTEQCLHPDFRRWRAELRLGSDVPREDVWAQAFPLQTFSRFGALVPGARAIGINVRDQAVPALLATLGCTVLCVEHAEPPAAFDSAAFLHRLQRPAICPADRFAEAVSAIGLDIRFPEMVRGDFAVAWVDSRASVTRFEDAFWMAMQRLNPGGLCVHIFLFDPVGEGEVAIPGRARVERLAMNAISFGHDVVQLSFRMPLAERRAPSRAVPFGLIAHRA